VLYNLHGRNDGRDPWGPVTVDSLGRLLGTAHAGKQFGGVVFGLNPGEHGKWSYAVLYNFAGAPDGAYPISALVQDGSGTVYSTTQAGGTGQACQGGCGTVFEASP
jgi:hypothetical protein